MPLDPSRAGERLAANDAAYDDDPTAELEAPITCELEEEYVPGPAPAASLRDTTTPASPPTPAPSEATPPPGIGTVLRDRYVLEDVVGSGGFSIVYRARDLRRDATDPEGNRVAIKLLRPECAGSATATARLKREFRQLCLLAHPGIVRVFDLDCHDGFWFEVMELLQGRTLSSLLRQRDGEPLPDTGAMNLLLGCGEALEHAHARGVVHGDVKPGNVFVRDSGDACLLDFGSVPLAGEEDTDPRRVGTFGYSSPEVLRGLPAAAADDVYSLACIALELVTGRSPSTSAGAAAGPADMAGLTAVQAGALGAALSDERAARPASPRAFLEQLCPSAREEVETPAGTRAMVTPEATPDPSVSPSQPARRSQYLTFPSTPWPWLLLLTVAVAAGAWFLVVWNGEDDAGSPRRASAPVAVESPPVTAGVTVPAMAPLAQGPAEAPLDEGSAEGTEGSAVLVGSSPPPPPARAAPLSAVSFRTASMTVSRLANAAAVELWREGAASGRSRIGWQISEGSATAGRDFDGPLSGEEVFVDGQRARVLFVPIRRDEESRSDRSFTVTLRPLETRTGLGEQPSIRVTILSPEDLAAQVADR